jgi:hypothetical protein
MKFKEQDILAGALDAILQKQKAVKKLTVNITLCGFV